MWSAMSRKQRLHLACFAAARARFEKHTMAMPAGSMKPFCEPDTATSTFQASMRKSMLAMELTPSTISSAGCLRRSMARRSAATSLVTPVAVSLWHTSTALIRCSLSARRMSRKRSTGTPSPQVTCSSCTSRPMRSARSAHRCENWPKRAVSTRSPGDRVLVSATSQPAVPVAGKTKLCPDLVWKILFRSRRIGFTNCGKSGARWSSIGTTMAFCTATGMWVGPGAYR